MIHREAVVRLDARRRGLGRASLPEKGIEGRGDAGLIKFEGATGPGLGSKPGSISEEGFADMGPAGTSVNLRFLGCVARSSYSTTGHVSG